MAAQTIDMSTRVVVSKLVRVAAAFLAVLVALPLVGIDITALSIFSGALGVGLGFGLQKIAANYVSGFIVLLDRSLRIGDTVTVADRRGEEGNRLALHRPLRRRRGGVDHLEREADHRDRPSPHLPTPGYRGVAATVAHDSESTGPARCCSSCPRAGARCRAPIDRTREGPHRPRHSARAHRLGSPANPGPGESDLRSELYKDLLKSFRAAGISLAYPRRDVHLFPTAETQE